MCEMNNTWSADKALAEDGYSVADFLAWKAKRTKPQPKKTREEWLNQFKDCGHCKYDGNCSAQRFGYSQKYNHEEYVNRMKNGAGYKSCCMWSGDVANALHDKVEILISKGEVI